MPAKPFVAPRQRAAGLLLLSLLLSALPPSAATAQAPAAAPPPPSATAPGPAGYKGIAAEVKEREALRFDTTVKGDLVLLERLLAEDLTYTHSSGVVDTKASYLDALKSGKLRYLALNPAETEVKILGEAGAVAMGRIEMKVVLEGKESTFQARYTSVYVKRHGQWLLVAWESTRIP